MELGLEQLGCVNDLVKQNLPEFCKAKVPKFLLLQNLQKCLQNLA
jgi:hypothetical protein